MIRVRKLVLAIAAATSLTSGMAHALGLGEISLKSALNQPLNADIDLLEVRDLDKTEIIPRLASAEDFSKAGVERDFFLTNLKFTPVILPNGKSMIHVTSAKPVREPYLNFLVEVIWPSGRVLREYTLLLDPPMYSPETAAVAPSMPVTAPAPVSRSPNQPVDGPFKVGSLPGSKYSSTAASQPRPVPASSAALDGQYKTGRNDTLWEIAQRVKGGGSLDQTMLAIQDLNPDAFVGGNINRLKSGQVLRLPDAAQINARSRSEAASVVAEQNSAWREGRSLPSVTARQLDATKRDAAGAAPAEVEAKDSLRLVAADVGQASSGSEKGADGDSKVLSDKLAVMQESLDTSRRQSDELSSRVNDLEGQLEKLQKLIALKDNQLAQLQADLAAREKLAESTASEASSIAATTPSAEVASPETPVAESTNTAIAALTPSATEEQPEELLAEGVNDVQAQPETVNTPAQQTASEPKAVANPVEAATPAAIVEPVQIVTETVVEEVPEPVSLVDEVLGNPLYMGAAGAGLLVILLGLMAMSRRNSLKEQSSTADAAVLGGSDDNSFADDIDLPEDSFAGLDDVGYEPEDVSVKAPAVDVLAEVEGYIAYGKFNQAAELLQRAINAEPHRTDLQLKLLEVTAEMGDREGFLRQAADLEEMGGVDADLQQLKARYPAMVAAGFAAGVGAVAAGQAPSDLDIDDLISDAPLASPAQDQDDAFDMSLDDLEAAGEDAVPAAAPQSGSDLDEFSLDVDFDQPESKQMDDPGFDLSLDDLEFEPSALVAKPDDAQTDGDFSDFNFDDLGTDTASAVESSSEFSLDADGDFEFESLPQATEETLGNEIGTHSSTDQLAPADFDLPVTDDLQSLEPVAESQELKVDLLDDDLTDLDDGLEAFAETRQIGSEDLLPLSEDEDEEFDFLSGTDETATKLDLARAYIDMGDAEGARDILEEVLAEGNEAQQQEAHELIDKLV